MLQLVLRKREVPRREKGGSETPLPPYPNIGNSGNKNIGNPGPGPPGDQKCAVLCKFLSV